ncbi:MAG TPA: helix-turn-helix transcriptional regulator [Stellaceae bacterium]|nr:helix-turn-helix transcriptional regulator [Stellaceae bacterium]
MELLRLIDLVHAAAVDMQAWPAALTAIADALGARATSLSIIDPENNAAPFVCAPRTDPLWLRAYHERWAASNLVRNRGYALPPGELYDFESLGMPRSQFDRTEFYNEFCAPQQSNFGLIMLAAKEETAVSAIGFYRSTAAGRFAADDERLLRELAPHLRRAVSLNLRLAQLDTQRSLTLNVLNHVDRGALLVDAQARILFANTAAEAALSEGGGLRVSGGRLATRIASKTAALQATIASGMNGTLALTCAAGTRLTVEIVALRAKTWRLPQRPAAIVFIESARRNIMPSPEQIGRLFDLTPAQAALARELLHGDGIPAAAVRLGISRSTARTHLLKLFEKTGTNRQAELVRLILQQETARAAPDRGQPANDCRNDKPRAGTDAEQD